MSQPSFEAAAPTGTPSLGEPSAPSVKQKTPINIYTLMLVLSFLALLIGTIILFFELRSWGPFPGKPWQTGEADIRTAQLVSVDPAARI